MGCAPLLQHHYSPLVAQRVLRQGRGRETLAESGGTMGILSRGVAVPTPRPCRRRRACYKRGLHSLAIPGPAACLLQGAMDPPPFGAARRHFPANTAPTRGLRWQGQPPRQQPPIVRKGLRTPHHRSRNDPDSHDYHCQCFLCDNNPRRQRLLYCLCVLRLFQHQHRHKPLRHPRPPRSFQHHD